MKRAGWEAVATDAAQDVGRKPAFVLAEAIQNAGHAPDAIGDLAEKLSGRARPEAAEMFSTALQTEPGKRVEVDHDVPPELSEAAQIGYTRNASRDVAARSAPPLYGGAGGLLLRRFQR
jgi:hypothetical protein